MRHWSNSSRACLPAQAAGGHGLDRFEGGADRPDSLVLKGDDFVFLMTHPSPLGNAKNVPQNRRLRRVRATEDGEGSDPGRGGGYRLTRPGPSGGVGGQGRDHEPSKRGAPRGGSRLGASADSGRSDSTRGCRLPAGQRSADQPGNRMCVFTCSRGRAGSSADCGLVVRGGTIGRASSPPRSVHPGTSVVSRGSEAASLPVRHLDGDEHAEDEDDEVDRDREPVVSSQHARRCGAG